MAHAKKCPPSSADRWMYCTASVPLILQLMGQGELQESDLEADEGVTEDDVLEYSEYGDVVLDPKRESSTFSAEGTVMHEIRQLCLEFGLSPMLFAGTVIGADGYTFEITEDMCDRLVAGIDWIREHTSAPKIEVRVDLSEWLLGQFGTCDTFWLVPVKRKPGVFDLYISDYKNGVGKPVAAEGNRQLRLYALGAWVALGKPNVRNVILNIDQPRAGGMKFWEITFVELMEFGEEVKRVWDRIERGDVEFVPTTAGCQWCPVRKTARGCAAYNRWILWMMGDALMDPSSAPRFKDPAQMDRTSRFYIVQHSAAIRAWLTKLYEESLGAAMRGDPDPGSKAIEGSEGNRYFSDEEQAKRHLVSALGRKAFKPRKLIGFTEIDSLMKPGRKKEGFPDQYEALLTLTRRLPGKPKLVLADHPKPAFQAVSGDDFDDLPEKGPNRLGNLADAFDDL